MSTAKSGVGLAVCALAPLLAVRIQSSTAARRTRTRSSRRWRVRSGAGTRLGSRLRPGWFFVTSGDGVETRWPAVPEVPHRLNLNRRQVSICARIVVTGAGCPSADK